MSNFAEIIRAGKASGKSIPEINAELKAAGAAFHLDPDHTGSGWTEEEMAEGFRPPEKEPETVKCAMRRTWQAGPWTSPWRRALTG